SRTGKKYLCSIGNFPSAIPLYSIKVDVHLTLQLSFIAAVADDSNHISICKGSRKKSENFQRDIGNIRFYLIVDRLRISPGIKTDLHIAERNFRFIPKDKNRRICGPEMNKITAPYFFVARYDYFG